MARWPVAWCALGAVLVGGVVHPHGTTIPHDLAATEMFDERAVGVPAVVFLPRYVEAGLRDLSVSWWEDHLEAAAAARAVPAWLPWLGAGLAAVVASLTWWRVRALGRGRAGGHGS